MQPVISVADYLELVNAALRTIPSENVVIEGEVAGFKVSHDTWVTFDLKDEKADALLPCFLHVSKLTVPIESGMRVHVAGYARVKEQWGKFSLNVTSVVPTGEGALAKAYQLVKVKLDAEGLFNVLRKRAIPRFPERIGLITSKEAAAYGDFMRILQNRWGGVTVVHASVHVQGQLAVPEILAAFAQFNAMSAGERPDVLVLTRGGGSLEDLHAFNDEQVARAVFSSHIPVVVGVGHERDESLCDFVADVRASTPSNAAERVVPDRGEMLRSITFSAERMASTFMHRIDRHRDRGERAMRAIDRFFSDIAAKLASAERFLASVDPANVLGRGYAIVRKGDVVVKDPATLAHGDALRVQLARGTIDADVRNGRVKSEKRKVEGQTSLL